MHSPIAGVSLFIRCTMGCEIWAQPAGSSADRVLCLECCECESHTRQFIFHFGKVTALGVLCCSALFDLACFSIPPFFIKNIPSCYSGVPGHWPCILILLAIKKFHALVDLNNLIAKVGGKPISSNHFNTPAIVATNGLHWLFYM